MSTLPQLLHVIRETPAQQVALPKDSTVNVADQTIQDKSLNGENLQGAIFRNTHLISVDLGDANLSGADLRGAVMEQVNIGGADLCGADIRGADLRDALHLNDVSNWDFTFYDKATRFPAGLDVTTLRGPQPDVGFGLIYMCTPGNTKLLPPSADLGRS